MKSPNLRSLFATIIVGVPVVAQSQDCLMGEVNFKTAEHTQTLTLHVHEQPFELARGLMFFTELSPSSGVFTIYPKEASARRLVNSDVFAADLMSFDMAGNALELMEDQTGTYADYMYSGVGMLYAAYLAGGTIREMGFDPSTVMTGWTCTEEK